MHKISIISRGQALGYTITLPTEDKFMTTKEELMDKLAMTLGGRAAEEIVFDDITTGAANDLERATDTAKQMIMQYGMSEELGPRTLGHDQAQPFLGREFEQQADYSDEMAQQIDDEIRRIIEEAHQRATGPARRATRPARPHQQILIERETIERASSRRCSTACPRRGLPRAGREGRSARQGSRRAPRSSAARQQPPVPKPAHVNPVNPEAT